MESVSNILILEQLVQLLVGRTGGFGKYEDTLNFTSTHTDYQGKGIPNLVYGWSQDNLKAVRDGTIDLITIENGPFTNADVLKEALRTLKKGTGELRVLTTNVDYDMVQYAKDNGLEIVGEIVKTKYTDSVSGQVADAIEVTFKKKE